MGDLNARRSEKPTDRLTRIADELTKALDARDDVDDVRALIMLNDAHRGGVVIWNYEREEGGDISPMVDLFAHLQAIFEANGKTLAIVPLGEG